MREPNEQFERDMRSLLKLLACRRFGIRAQITDEAFAGVHRVGLLPRCVIASFGNVMSIVVKHRLFGIGTAPNTWLIKDGRLSAAGRSRFRCLFGQFNRLRFCIGGVWVDFAIKGGANWRDLVVTLHETQADGSRARRASPLQF